MVIDLTEIYPTLLNNHTRWDKQTVVIVCGSWERLCEVRSKLAKQRAPQSRHFIKVGKIESDSFVNLNYNPTVDKRPQDRNVRIVYVDGSCISAKEVYERFSDAYIVNVDAPQGWIERGDNIDTDEQAETGYIAGISSIPD